jgi:hypothetical protein
MKRIKRQWFKTRGIGYVIILLLMKQSLCSKEIAELFGNFYNDRNIQKVLLRLNKLKILDFMGIGLNALYPKSKFFEVNKGNLANMIINERKSEKEKLDKKAAEIQAIPPEVFVPSNEEEAIKSFLNLFEIKYYNNKIRINLKIDGKGIMMLAELNKKAENNLPVRPV